MSIPEFTDLISALTVDAINVQLRLNRSYEFELQQFTQLSGIESAFLLPLLPRRLHLDRFDLSLGVGVSVTKDVRFAVRALPLNAEFYTRTAATSSRYGRVCLSVHQIPIPEGGT